MKKIVLPIVAAAAMLLFAACSAKEAAPNQPQVIEPDRPAKVENDVQQQQQDEQPQDDVIETVYGELTYPGMWADRVSYDIVENGADVQITFYAKAEDTEVDLFTLCYGTVPENGYEMGSLLVEDDMVVPVSTVMYPIVPEEGWSEETVNELSALQESINDLLIQLRAYPNYTE